MPNTGAAALSVGPSTALDAAALLRALDRYPFGCSEQITSRALPLLYVNELASAAHLAMDDAVDQRIRDAIDRLLARQSSNGSFGLWGIGGDDAWLDAYVTDFLTRARERGFAVPEVAFKLALDRLRNTVAQAPAPAKDGGRDLAYALYVLARNGTAPLGDLRYLADAKLDDLATPIAKAQIAAALGLLGDRIRAERVYKAALDDIKPKPQTELFSRVDYGSTLRDAAALVTLASEAGGSRPTISNAVLRIEEARAHAPYTSTQENAWLVLAARAIAKDAGITLDVGGEAHKGALYRNAKASELAQPFKVTNTGEAPLQAVVSVSGAPTVPEPAAESGFKLERLYYTLDGEPADPTKAKQNQRFVVVLKITEPVRSSAGSSSPTICRPALRSTIRGWSPRAKPERCPGSRTPRSRSIPSSATTASAPRSRADREIRWYSAWPMWCGRSRPAATPCRRPMSRTCTGPTASAGPRPASSRSAPSERIQVS